MKLRYWRILAEIVMKPTSALETLTSVTLFDALQRHSGDGTAVAALSGIDNSPSPGRDSRGKRMMSTNRQLNGASRLSGNPRETSP